MFSAMIIESGIRLFKIYVTLVVYPRNIEDIIVQK